MVLEDFVPFDVLQSQLFILKMLSACMTQHWNCHRELLEEQESAARSSLSDAKENSGASNQNNDDTVSIHSDNGLNNYASLRKLEDPPPLEEQLAKNILNVLS